MSCKWTIRLPGLTLRICRGEPINRRTAVREAHKILGTLPHKIEVQQQ